MQSALQEVNEGNVSLRGASRKYSIPLTSIHDRVSGKVGQAPKWGKPTKLSTEKETELIQYAMKRADLGIGFSKKTFLRFAGKFAEDEGVKFTNGVATDKWWRGLKQRHPDFSLRSPEATSSGRHMAMTRLRLARYYAELNSVLQKHDLKDKGAKIWNMDETGLSLTHKPPKIIAKKGSKAVHSKVSTSRELITVIACGNADGSVIPPHVIVPGKTKRSLNSYDIENAPVGTNISVSDSGWTKVGIGLLWFAETFLANIGPERPQMLVFDGHESHNHIEFIEKARQEQIILIELPSKTSHWTQPFDRTVFKSLKSHWNTYIDEFTSETGVAVGHGQFFRLLNKSWKASMSSSNIKNGFVKTGICPYNPGVILNEAFDPAELYEITEGTTSVSDESQVGVSNGATASFEPQASTSEELPSNVNDKEESRALTINPVMPVIPTPDDNLEVQELKESMCVSFDIYSEDQVIDLPLAIDETGAMCIINMDKQLQGPSSITVDSQPTEASVAVSASFAQPTEVSVADSASFAQPSEASLTSSSPTVQECPPSVALSIIEAALTDDILRKFRIACEDGEELNDSMFQTWKTYKNKLGQKECPQVKKEHTMLTFPKQVSKKKPQKKGRSSYFVISSDVAYREMLSHKEEKEKKKEEVEQRKRAREELKKEKETNKQAKLSKKKLKRNVEPTVDVNQQE